MLVLVAVLFGALLRTLLRWALARSPRAAFWSRQATSLFVVLLILVGFASIWFDDPTRLTTALGLVTAGLAFALQKVVTAIAAYFVILRGRTFNVGDRIVMGGVRGDVIALGLTQTTIMEMGQPPPVQDAPPPVWVQSRQYTGRIVTISNSKIFDEPVYNYTRDFPYVWEELRIPVPFSADRRRAEEILLEAVAHHATPASELGEQALAELQRRYFMSRPDVSPRVYYRLTDNWLELTVRFLTRDHGMREIKDAMAREIMDSLERARIPIASATFEVVGLPELRIADAKSGAATRPMVSAR